MVLQWSHVFSDMVRGWGRVPFVEFAKLQWSHVFSDMVRRVAGVEDLNLCVASMEPCLFRHGKIRDVTNFYEVITRFNGAMSFQTW